MFNPFVLFLVFFFSAFLLLKLTKSRKYKLPPSPPRLPIIGNLHQLSSLPHHSLRLLSDKYGPLLLIHMGQSRAVVVSSPEIVREIMKTHDTIFANRQKTVAADVLFYGGNEVVFSPHDENWKEARKILVSELLSQGRLQLLHDNRKKEVELMIAKIRQSCVNQKVPVNIGEMMFSMFATVFCEFVFGGDYGGEEYGKQFTRLAQKISELVLAFSFKEFFPIMGWMDKFTGLDARLEETWKEIDDFLDRVIKEHERHMKSRAEQFEEKDCVDVLLHLKNGSLAGADLTMDNIKALILI
ncbi:Cytochrome P450 [Dillenia turbinata]|uniref:Cytochrome P450 n=1 Tax=Dillenia turbinata TaxID=194707 RepID=A0AAN8URW6_9MAGN